MITKDYIFTKYFSRIEDINFEENAVFIYGSSPENRTEMLDYFREEFKEKLNFIKIVDIKNDFISISANTNKVKNISLRSAKNINSIFEQFSPKNVYIEISGLSCRVLAPLIKSLIESYKTNKIEIKLIYSEPISYNIDAFSRKCKFNNLAEDIDGISPLPGFSSLLPDTRNILFIPFLGFEGGRFSHILNTMNELEDNIIPIIGISGFRLEYLEIALWKNITALEDSDSWSRIDYATANSIIDAYYKIEHISKLNPDCKLKIAPIGTKPHAMGAIIYSILNPDKTELIYDNPRRKESRTNGVKKLIVTDLSILLKEYYATR